MKRLGKKFLAAAMAIVSALSISGCSVESGDALASLPRLPGEYLALQQEVDAILAQGYIPAVAESGQNRQAMQQQDIDGDGQKEIISFYRSSTSGEYMIYVHKRQGDDYGAGACKGIRTVFEGGILSPVSKQWRRHRSQLGHGGRQCLRNVGAHFLGSDGLNEALAVRYMFLYCGCEL